MAPHADILKLRQARQAVAMERPQTRKARKAYRRGARRGVAVDALGALKATWLREVTEDVAAAKVLDKALVESAPARAARCQRTMAYVHEAIEFAGALAGASTIDGAIVAVINAITEHPGIPIGDDDRLALGNMVEKLMLRVQ